MEPPLPRSTARCTICQRDSASYSLRTGNSYTEKAGLLCQRCAVPYVDRPDSLYLIIPTFQEEWIDETRNTYPTLGERELLQAFFISQSAYAAQTSIVRSHDAGPTRASEILYFSIQTAHAILGPFSPEILRSLGFTSARAYGDILYGLIGHGFMHEEPGDARSDFVSEEFDRFVSESMPPTP